MGLARVVVRGLGGDHPVFGYRALREALPPPPPAAVTGLSAAHPEGGLWHRARAVAPAGVAWEGVCGCCGETRPAVALRLVLRPFGRGAAWACGGGTCRGAKDIPVPVRRREDLRPRLRRG